MAAWLIKKDVKVRQYWDRLSTRPEIEQTAFEDAENLLREKPYPFDNAPGVIKHLKGGYHCHHEYRNLPNAQRIFYKIWTRADIDKAVKQKQANVPQVEAEDQPGVVVMFFAGPHPR